MIELKNLQKTFDNGATYAVADTSFSVEKGELLGLIGESGSGKTTTLKMINRLEEPSSGEVYVNGQNVLAINPEELRRNIGYVFQGNRLISTLHSCRECRCGASVTWLG